MEKGAFRILLLIATHLNHKKEAWPGIKRLMELSGLNRDRVYSCINNLIELGCIERHQSKKTDGTFTRRIYKLTQKYIKTYVHTTNTELSEIEPLPENSVNGEIRIRQNQEGEVLNSKEHIVELGNSTAYKEIVAYLNERTKSKYRHTTKKTQALIRARLREGFSLDDFKRVIDVKARKWINTQMQDYLRPQTLFGTKFEAYLNEATKLEEKENSQTAGDGKWDENYARYLAWVKENCPTLADQVRYLSKQQFIQFKERKYTSGLSGIGEAHEERCLKRAHIRMEQDQNIQRRFDNAFQYHINQIDEVIKAALMI